MCSYSAIIMPHIRLSLFELKFGLAAAAGFFQDPGSSFSGGGIIWVGGLSVAALSFRSHRSLSCKTAGLRFQKTKQEFMVAVTGAGVTFLSGIRNSQMMIKRLPADFSL